MKNKSNFYVGMILLLLSTFVVFTSCGESPCTKEEFSCVFVGGHNDESIIRMDSDGSFMVINIWDNDWNKFKRLFKAVGWLNSITKALKYGEILAYKASKEVKNEMCDEQVEDLKLKAMGQSPKLVALLTLAIANSVGAQQSM